MATPDRDINRPTSILAAIGIVVMAPMFFLVMPVYVGALADDYGFSNGQIGQLIFLELGGAAFASLSALFWLRKTNLRRAVIALLIVLAAANLVSALLGSIYDSLQPIRAVAGLAMGGLMAIALAVLGDTQQKDRNFAYSVVGQLGVSGTLLLFLPWLVGRLGAPGVFSVFLLASVLVIPLTIWFPVKGKREPIGQFAEDKGLMPLWGLAGSAAIFIGQSAVWAFIERMGAASGLSAQTIGLALGLSVFAGLGGALVASLLTDRVGRLQPMATCMIGQVVCLVFLFNGFPTTTYFAAVILYSVFWNLWLPYQYASVATADVSGRFVALIPFSQATGIAIGPALVGPMIDADNYDAVIWAGIAFAVIALILFLPIASRRRLPLAESMNR